MRENFGGVGLLFVHDSLQFSNAKFLGAPGRFRASVSSTDPPCGRFQIKGGDEALEKKFLDDAKKATCADSESPI